MTRIYKNAEGTWVAGPDLSDYGFILAEIAAGIAILGFNIKDNAPALAFVAPGIFFFGAAFIAAMHLYYWMPKFRVLAGNRNEMEKECLALEATLVQLREMNATLTQINDRAAGPVE